MPKGRLAATLALIAVFAFWGLCDYEHRRALAALESRNYQGTDALRVSAFPNMSNPFRWHGVIEASSFFATMDVDSLAPEVDPHGEMQVLYKPEETVVSLAAKKTYVGRVYLSWAAYPLVEVEELANDPVAIGSAAYVVRFRDLRYGYLGRNKRTGLDENVYLTRDLKVVANDGDGGKSGR